MGKTMALTGYFSAHRAKPEPRSIQVSIDGYGLNETLTVHCQSAYKVSFPYRPAERMAAQLRRERSSPGVQEPSVQVEGMDEQRRSGPTTLWLRATQSFEMLTVELEGRGQISLPFAPVENLVRAERATMA